MLVDDAALSRAARTLARREPRFAAILREHGVPPLWARAPGFATLTYIILEQQVSLASARATYERLRERLGAVTPHGLLTLSDSALKAIGFSRQKAGYARGLAAQCVAGFDLDGLASLDDATAERALVASKGIGPWTAHIYLMMALGRPDIFPARDLALAVSVQRLWRLRARPDEAALARRAEAWRPYRAVAARLLWHHYLSAPR